MFNQDEILEAQTKFYCNLYSKWYDNANIDSIDKYLHLINLPHISQNTFDLYESKLKILEIKKTIKDLEINKTYGPDGLLNEFYKTFTSLIQHLLTKEFSLKAKGRKQYVWYQKGKIANRYFSAKFGLQNFS